MSRILEYITKYDENLTIAELKKAIEQDKILTKQKETEEINRVKEEFENIYLKEIVDCTFYGETIKVYHLKNYVRSERTTDWDLIYYFEGSKVSFSKRDLSQRDFNTDRIDESFSAKELENMTKITEEEYEGYVWHYNQISKQLKDLIR